MYLPADRLLWEHKRQTSLLEQRWRQQSLRPGRPEQSLQRTERERVKEMYKIFVNRSYYIVIASTDPKCTCAGGAEGVTTGALTAGAVEEVMKSPDKMSRASAVPMVG